MKGCEGYFSGEKNVKGHCSGGKGVKGHCSGGEGRGGFKGQLHRYWWEDLKEFRIVRLGNGTLWVLSLLFFFRCFLI